MFPVLTAIALGSNLGDRQAHLAHAFEALSLLEQSALLARAPIVETEPIALPGVESGGPYLNSAALVQTRLLPRELLVALQAIERDRGRSREREFRWGPRTLDLDLLVYGPQTINEPGLTIPHPRIAERRFVLEPLASIAPDLVIPGLGRVADLLQVFEASN